MLWVGASLDALSRISMRPPKRHRDCPLKIILCFSVLALILTPAITVAQTNETEEFDQYKVRVSGFWLYSSPNVNLEAAAHNGIIHFNQDFNFGQYSTFLGKVDWKFTRKNHLYFSTALFNQSQQAVLNRTITFRGQTFFVGATAKGTLQATVYTPGYQYDIIRRKRGHLGVGAQVNIFNTSGKISAAAQITGAGMQQAAVSSRASLLAPLPVIGPEFRLYVTNSPRLFINGQVFGMYFFGYGYYASTVDFVGLSITKNLSINGGYAYASRLRITDTSNRVGLNLTQKGPVAGIEVSF